ncbi:MAG: hypothetical protein PHU68_00545 [Paludibacter sp.]|nr:hypothetical protein [Paludibacter sp.]
MKTTVAKGGLPAFFATAPEGVAVGVDGIAQVGPVEFALVVEDFGITKRHLIAGLAPYFHAQPSDHVLSHVHDKYAGAQFVDGDGGAFPAIIRFYFAPAVAHGRITPSLTALRSKNHSFASENPPNSPFGLRQEDFLRLLQEIFWLMA